MLRQSMVAIQKPGNARVCRYGGAAEGWGGGSGGGGWGYSCLSSQIDAVAFNRDFMVSHKCISMDTQSEALLCIKYCPQLAYTLPNLLLMK